MIRKKEIVEHVVMASGLRKRDAREALDQAFAFIRTSLLEGKEIDCPPLGKIKVHVQGPNSDNPKLHFRVIPRREATDADADTNTDEDTKIHLVPQKAAEG